MRLSPLRPSTAAAHSRRSAAAIARAVVLATLLVAVMFGVTGCRWIIDAGGGTESDAAIAATENAESAIPSLPVAPLPLAGKVLPPPTGAYLGVYSPPAPFVPSRVDQFESEVGKDAAIVMWYQPWATNNRARFDAAACLEVMRRGKVPMITWEPWDPGSDANQVKNPTKQPAYRLKAINDGVFDAYIRQWAVDIKKLGGPVMLRPMHEMNGNWYPWGGTVNGNKPAEFVTAWRRIHDIFEAEGATNVTWVWSINHESVPSGDDNAYAAYYPGDEYVDWTSISGFNWGTTSNYSRWMPFTHWYAKPLGYLKTIKKPICISEFASVEQGGKKSVWITDAYTRIRANSQVRAIIYYDSIEKSTSSTQDWRVTSSAESLAAFSKAISPTYFVGTPPQTVTSWADSLDKEDWRYLAILRPIY